MECLLDLQSAGWANWSYTVIFKKLKLVDQIYGQDNRDKIIYCLTSLFLRYVYIFGPQNGSWNLACSFESWGRAPDVVQGSLQGFELESQMKTDSLTFCYLLWQIQEFFEEYWLAFEYYTHGFWFIRSNVYVRDTE